MEYAVNVRKPVDLPNASSSSGWPLPLSTESEPIDMFWVEYKRTMSNTFTGGLLLTFLQDSLNLCIQLLGGRLVVALLWF